MSYTIIHVIKLPLARVSASKQFTVIVDSRFGMDLQEV